MLVLLIGVAALSACREAEETTPRTISRESPLRIAVSIHPIALIVHDFIPASATDLIQVETVIHADASPHGFEPTPGQIARLHRADLVIHIGLGLDDWAARGLPDHVRVVRLADLLKTSGDDAEENHEHHHDHNHDHGDAHDHSHHHGPVDEHLWLDPPIVAAAAARIAAELRLLLAKDDRAREWHGELDEAIVRFSAAIQTMDRRIVDELEPYAGRRLITHHNVFSRLTQRYGLGEPIVLRPLAVIEPSPADLRRAIETAREENISAILIEPQLNPQVAERLRDEVGVHLIRVDPLGRDAHDWPAMMQDILDALLECLRINDGSNAERDGSAGSPS